MLVTTTTSEHIGHWIKMRRPLARFSGLESSIHARYSASSSLRPGLGFRYTQAWPGLGNLEAALSEEPRPRAKRKLTGKEEALLVATACDKTSFGAIDGGPADAVLLSAASALG
jgi:hypothetical protein